MAMVSFESGRPVADRSMLFHWVPLQAIRSTCAASTGVSVLSRWGGGTITATGNSASPLLTTQSCLHPTMSSTRSSTARANSACKPVLKYLQDCRSCTVACKYTCTCSIASRWQLVQPSMHVGYASRGFPVVLSTCVTLVMLYMHTTHQHTCDVTAIIVHTATTTSIPTFTCVCVCRSPS